MGRLGVISYVTNGSSRYPKEIFEVSASGRSARIDNFKRATVWSGRRKRVARRSGRWTRVRNLSSMAFVEAVRNETGHADIASIHSSQPPGPPSL